MSRMNMMIAALLAGVGLGEAPPLSEREEPREPPRPDLPPEPKRRAAYLPRSFAPMPKRQVRRSEFAPEWTSDEVASRWDRMSIAEKDRVLKAHERRQRKAQRLQAAASKGAIKKAEVPSEGVL